MVWTEHVGNYLGQYRYLRYVVFGVALGALVVAAAFGYRYYVGRYTQQAQASLARSIALYERAERENTKDLWDSSEQAFSQGYTEFSGTALAPYFLAFQSEVALKQGRGAEARELLEKAMSQLATTSPLQSLYATKLALMQIDSNDPEIIKQGHTTLQALASNPKNQDRDTALYYQGLIAFDSGDRGAAEKAWNVLIETYGADSVWAQVAQSKLEYVS